ncbi:MAG TPA: amino acid adenylation domain-containing protein [Kofleriaceae bacterium]|nr:amino acid adenylation domain-containing protein [Kofleriaceae bacterium]
MTTRHSHINSLVDVLQRWSVESPDRDACRFPSFGAAAERGVNYRQLVAQARAVGAALQARIQRGDRVILLYPPALDFVISFLGSFHAGAIAVPVYPPDPSKPGRDLVKLRAIIADAKPAMILSTSGIRRLVAAAGDDARDLNAMAWLETDKLALDMAADWRDPGVIGSDIAFLQYTSGSTGQPKGVMVSHGNLLDNVRCLEQVFEDDASSPLVSWLPLYHDMGLIGNLLHGLYVGTTCLLMSPMEFLEQPLRWLETITKYRAHTSGGPNFAYELCVRKIAPAQRAGLDLGSWRVAFNGAEPVRRSTLDRFAEAFAPHGFRREAFFPCYGLAESTLIVSGSDKSAAPRFAQLDTAALERGGIQVVPDTQAESRAFVGCGKVIPDHRLAIVDPHSLARCAPDTVGEIWVAGPSVAQGYWGKPEQTLQTFGAMLADGSDGPFLRTGDLGFVRDGELFITGRFKDLIIVRGRNHYPQDLELTAEQAYPGLRPGCGAAFTVDAGTADERLVMVFEIDRKHRDAPIDDIAAAVVQRIAEHHELELHELVLIEQSRIPKTTSGKIQRSTARIALASGKLPVVARWQRPTTAPAASAEVPEVGDAQPQAPTSTDWLRDTVARVLELPVAALRTDVPLVQLGLSSLRAVELRSAIASVAGAELAFAELFQATSLADLAARIAAHGARKPLAPLTVGGPRTMSFAQQRLWLIAQLAPESADYNECLILRLGGAVQPDALDRALHAIAERHEILRTAFVPGRDGATIELTDRYPAIARATAASDAEAMHDIRALAAQPFDLSRAPLIRAQLTTIDAEHHVLGIVVHHILCDGRSAQLLCDELAARYDACVRGTSIALPALPAQYADLARAERDQLHGDTAQLAYWRDQLAHMPTSVALPIDDDLATAARHARCVGFSLSAEASTELRALAAREGVTTSAALLAALFALLQRYSGQDDLPVGMPVSRRDRPEATALIGFFVNTLVMRGNTEGDPTFRELLARTGATVVAGLEHQALPFDALVEALRPERRATQSPLFNVMWAFEGAAMPSFDAGGVHATPVTLDHATARFDLTVSARDTAGGITGAFEVDARKFSQITIARMARHFERLLITAITTPDHRLSELALDTTTTSLLPAPPALPLGPRVHDLVAGHARTTPDAIAVVDGTTALSYRALDRRARQLAHQLRAHGVGPDVIVGICLERSADLIVALVATLYAGGAYLPLDPSHPADRLRFVLDDAQAPVVIATGELAGQLLATDVVERAVLSPCGDDTSATDHDLPEVDASHLAYVIYTSGSTGVPKGVLIEHGAFAAYLATARAVQALTPADRMLQFAAPTFDIAHHEIFGALTTGATLILRGANMHASVAEFLAACEAQQLSVMFLPSAFWAQLTTELADRDLVFPSSVRLVFVGGEAMSAEALAAWQTLPRRPALINAYGPTETTIAVTTWMLGATTTAGVERAPIGTPLPGVEACVLDGHRRPVPHGVAGELYLGGVQLARGYLRRPELTAASFVTVDGRRLYRTGDLVRVRTDGNLVFLGRTDHQVKLRGFRIELGEVEAALTSHGAVRDAVVLCLDQALIGYVVRNPDSAVDAATLRAHLQSVLPAPMVPAQFAVLDRWPLTAHGKVDRRALAAIPTAVVTTDLASATPRTQVEELVAGCFCDVLRVDHVQLHDDFFALGGHSLLAMRLLSRLHDALGVQLPFRALFESPTVAALAAQLATANRDTAPELVAEPHTGTAPMSFGQQRLWFLDRLEPGATIYNMTGGYRLHGALDRGALGRALTALVARHEVLRTQLLAVDGVPVQRIAPPAPQPLALIDLTTSPDRDAALADHLEREAATPFDLARGPLFRTQLLAMATDDHVLVLSLHHAIGDGWSISVMIDDLAALYAAELGAGPAPAPLAIQYADHARWQHRWLDSRAIDTQLGYWKDRLAGNLPVLQIPAARRRPPVQTVRGATIDFTVPPALTGALHQLGQREGATLFMTLMTAFQILLRRYSGQDDIRVGTPMAGRLRSETEALIGLFLNTVVIRGDLTGDPSFRTLLGKIREATLEAWAHQDVPFEKLVEELNPERSLSYSPIFQVMFVLHNTPIATTQLADVAIAQVPLRDRSAKFDLSLSMAERGDAIHGSLHYNVDLFDAVTVERMVDQFLVLLAGIVRAPDTTSNRLPLTTDAERTALAIRNATDAPYPHDRCLDQLFSASAARTPDALAVVSGSQRLTYGALQRRRNQLGHRLRRLGARPNTAIAIVMDKGWEQVVAMLGIHAAGAAYLPIDPGIPHDRLAYILDHAQVEFVVTQPWVELKLAWPSQVQRIVIDDTLITESNEPLAARHTPDDLAYILYTSGSTGHPKGVALRHRGAVNTVWDINTRFHVTADDRVIAMSAATFDLSVYDVFGTLGAGAAIVMPDTGSMRDPAHWAQLVRDECVSVWSSVPAYVQMLIALLETTRDGLLPSLRVIALSGDVLPLALPDRIRGQLGAQVDVVNLGGNTEASIWSVTFPVDQVAADWPSIPYGHPLANQRCYVLNAALVDCPTSVPGDLYFAGVGLAREYWRDPAKTDAYFFAHPETGERIYKTGDLAYWRADGELILLGRSDFQVKVQGFRIEPGEIEAALKKHASVREAIVLARDDVGGTRDKRLVAYVVARPEVAPADLRTFLAEWLPDYMIPSVFMLVPELPLSANGKIDRKALPAPDLIAQNADRFVAPRTPLEHATAALWCEVLGVERVGIHDNFFDLGGHSLLATRLVARLPAALGVELPLRTIFESPTIAEMGVAVAQQLASKKDDAHLASLLSELEGLSDAEAEDRLSHPSTLEG